MSLIILDLDNFKLLNDNFGHLVGDQMQKIVAERCSITIREADTIARYGGEEFVILLPVTELEEAVHVAGYLQSLVDEKVFDTDRGRVSVGISLGVAPSDQD